MKNELNINDLVEVVRKIDMKLYGIKNNEVLLTNLREEITELAAELDDEPQPTTERKFEQLKELGDVLFCIISLANQNNLDLPHALSLTLTKLQERIKFGFKNG
jgi:NTP pyrophosphatase (non-canonical NTP hydrolase)